MIVPTLLLALTMIGCGTKGQVETAKLEQSFQSASPSVKSDISQAAAAIKSLDFAKAVPILKKVIDAGGLTPEQKEGISTAIVGMQTVISLNPNKFSTPVYDAVTDLADHLEGRAPVMRTAK